MAAAKQYDKQTILRLTVDQYESAKKRASARNMRLADWMREAIDEKIKREVMKISHSSLQGIESGKDLDIWLMHMLESDEVKQSIRQIVSEGLRE